MTIAQFEAIGGSTETQALRCFLRLKDFLDGLDQSFETTRRMTVEVSRPESLETVMRARARVFGQRRPSVVSNRLTRLPPGELVRLTVELDGPGRGTRGEDAVHCDQHRQPDDPNAPTTGREPS